LTRTLPCLVLLPVVSSLLNITWLPEHSEIKSEFSAKGLKKAAAELDLLKLSPEERADYDSYIEDRRVGESSIKTSWLEGKMQGKLEVARNLQAARVALEIIMQTTGLSREEIERRI